MFFSCKDARTKLIEFCAQKEADKTRRKMNSFKKIALGLAAAMSFGVLSKDTICPAIQNHLP